MRRYGKKSAKSETQEAWFQREGERKAWEQGYSYVARYYVATELCIIEKLIIL